MTLDGAIREHGAMKLHIGSRTRAEGWTTLDIVPGEGVDIVGDCRDLSRFSDNSIETVYASHVLEHLRLADLIPTLKEWHRVLIPDGSVMISVPDMNILCRHFLNPTVTGETKFMVMWMMFGGQLDQYDFHFVGFDFEILGTYLSEAGFDMIFRVPSFALFDDTSAQNFLGVPLSLNVRARKPA